VPGSERTIVPSSGRLSWYSSGIGLLLVARLAAIEQLFGKRSPAAWKDRGFAWLPDLRLNNCSVFTGQPPGKPVQEHLLQTRTIVLSHWWLQQHNRQRINFIMSYDIFFLI
jgi:hypothetical protein